MKTLLLALGLFIPASCASHRHADRQEFIATPGPIEQLRDPSVEDYVLALPAYSFHEEIVPLFTERVRTARTLPENQNRSRDSLYLPGDGCWPAKEFTLDRPSRTLTIFVHGGSLAEEVPYTTTMRRVENGWIRVK